MILGRMTLNMDKTSENRIKSGESAANSETSSKITGLSKNEVEARFEKYGYNEIVEKKKHPLERIVSHFWGPIPWMIEVAAVLSAIIRHWEDFFIISSLLVLNAAVGFWQESKADNAIELLKQKLALQARVKRDGKWRNIPARELVPGDIVRLRLGDVIPADASLLGDGFLLIDEAALTGESLPVEKRMGDDVYSGSVIHRGEADAEVTATGMSTLFGKTAGLVAQVQEKSHFQKAVLKIGDYLIAVALVLVSVIFVVGLFRHESVPEILKFSLVLVVAAIPSALPAVMTVTLAVGAGILARKKAIVSRMVAIEELSGMDVLCSDKTGTITRNELSVAQIIPFSRFEENDVVSCAAAASREEDADPIDRAVLERSSEITSGGLLPGTVTDFVPFDPVSKRTEAVIGDEKGQSLRISKGAPQAILALLEERGALVQDVEKSVKELASRGYRSIAVARTGEDGKWEFVGLLGLYDAPRDDSADTIATAGSMGVEVKMVTGDHEEIAREVASQVGLGTDIQLPETILEVSDQKAVETAEEANGFARVFPEHKYHIVELLQAEGHIVGMTGDGVNDAPALKKADAGIAVSTATDAARSAADIVFTQPGLSVIVDAIKESRKIFQRMTNYTIYRITETIRMMLFITLSILVFNFYPVTALMVALLALLNDLPIMSIAYDNVRYSSDPEKWDFKVVLTMASFLGVIGVFTSFIILYLGQHVLALGREVLQTFIFLKLSVAGHLTVFAARTRGSFWTIKPAAAVLAATVSTQAVATLIAVYGFMVAPIGWRLALYVWGLAACGFFLMDFLKVRLYGLLDGHKAA
jgi:H+-transporting ATPase